MIGPLIQKTDYNISNDGKLMIRIFLMRQSNNYIHTVEEPYTMESVLRVKNCMYARYTGPEEKLKLAYDNIVADIFVEKLSNE